VPSEPRNAEVIPVTPTSVRVSWETPTQTKGRLLNYAVFYYVDEAVSEDEEISSYFDLLNYSPEFLKLVFAYYCILHKISLIIT